MWTYVPLRHIINSFEKQMWTDRDNKDIKNKIKYQIPPWRFKAVEKNLRYWSYMNSFMSQYIFKCNENAYKCVQLFFVFIYIWNHHFGANNDSVQFNI